jgi:hypothetical protein
MELQLHDLPVNAAVNWIMDDRRYVALLHVAVVCSCIFSCACSCSCTCLYVDVDVDVVYANTVQYSG